MNTTLKVLFCILVLQVGLVLLTHRKGSKNEIDLSHPLLPLPFEKVDRLVISGAESHQAVLSKEEGIWKSDEYFGFPLNQDKIGSLFTDLKELRMSWPVGKTLLAAKQFLVTKDNFEKKFEFYEGDNLIATLYFGSSPSFRKSHIRVEGEENTYAVKFSSYEYQVKSKSWLNRRFYKLERDAVERLELQDLGTISSYSGELRFSDLSSLDEMNEVKTNQIFSAALSPSFKRVVGKDSYEHGSKVLSYKLRTKDGKLISYDYYKKLKGDQAQEGEETSLILKLSSQPFYFEVNRSEVQDLVRLKRSDLVRRKELSEEKENASLKTSSREKQS